MSKKREYDLFTFVAGDVASRSSLIRKAPKAEHAG